MRQKPVNLAVKHDGGLVVLKFDRDVNYIELEPQNCLDIVAAMADAAFEAREGVKPAGPAVKAALVERQRDKLVPRVALILNSQRGNKKISNGQLSLTLVDTVFSEVYS